MNNTGIADIRDFDMSTVQQQMRVDLINLYDPSDCLFDWIQLIPMNPNYLYVAAHGNPELMGNYVIVNGVPYPKEVWSAEDIADIIIEAGWNGEIVYLLACNTGQDGVCGISQEIADFIGGVVRAPKEALIICDNGFYYVSDEERQDFDDPFFNIENQEKMWDERIVLTY